MSQVPVSKKNFIMKKSNIGDYYIIDTANLGAGTYGTVKKVTHKITKQERAVKIIPRNKIKNMDRFKMEVDILRTVDHPNIVKFFEWFEDDKNVYLVMEMCSGGELFDKIVQIGHFSEKQAAVVFKQILSALNYCHKMKICHRDLKPENFLFECKTVDASATLKLIDFGLSKIYADSNQKLIKMTTRAGTPYYIAPEVIEGNYDVSCDMWSAGVILYIILCGYPPFYGNNDNEILENVKKGIYDFNGDEWKPVSKQAISLIQNLITKPKDRLTAEQAMAHPWISSFATSGEKATSAETLTRSLKNIYVFKNLERLKKAVLTYIATQLNEKETISLKQVFQQFDKNGDGLITIEELYTALSKFKTKEEIKEIMDSCDINSKGNIDYTEFIAATMDESIYLQKDKLLAAFNLFDKDKSGKISTSELKEILGKDTDFSEQVWSDMIKQVDKNGDGEIDYDEFMGMMYDIRKQLSKLK